MGDDKKKSKKKKSSRRHSHAHDSDDKDSRSHFLLPKNVQPISTDDYFARSNEFKLWLRQKKDLFFDKLLSDDARHHFGKFVKRWNEGRLDANYYDYRKTAAGDVRAADLTSFKWKFKGVDEDQQQSVRDTISSQTEAVGGDAASHVGGWGGKKSESDKSSSSRPPLTGANNASSAFSSKRSYADTQLEREEREEADRMTRRKQAATSRKDREVMLDEIAPRETGRDAMIEKRKQQREVMKSFSDKRDYGDVEIPESDLFGSGGNDSFEAVKRSMERSKMRKVEAREAYRAEKDVVMSEKMAAFKAKEDSTMAMLRDLAKKHQQ